MIGITNNISLAQQHARQVVPVLEERIERVLNRGTIKYKKNTYKVTPELEKYLIAMSKTLGLEKLVLCPPSMLKKRIADLRSRHPNFLNTNHASSKILYNIFISGCYDDPRFDKTSFISNIKIDTCPYCNRTYTYVIGKRGSVKPEIDHFYDKIRYPFLGVSYYNLIPSCGTCNGRYCKWKSDADVMNLKNPYLIDPGEFRFDFKIQKIDYMNPLMDKTSVSISISTALTDHVTVFKLGDLYAMHTDHVLELIIKSQHEYSKRFREYLKAYRYLKFSDTELDRMILGNYSLPSEIHLRPLAKMYQDIGRKLGLIK